MANPTYTVTPISNRPNYGSVSAPVTDNAGVVAILTATPNEGYTFLCWSDGAIENPHRYTIPEKNVTVKAYFYQTNPFKFLLDLAGLSRYAGRMLTKIKAWYAEKATKLISGAKQIGFCKTDTSYTAEDVQDALEEVKTQSDASDAEIDTVKRTYMPLPEYSYTIVPTGGNMLWTSVTSSDNFSPYIIYYLDQNASSMVNFVIENCGQTDRPYDANEQYWERSRDPVTDDQIYTKWSGGQVAYAANKNNLYHVDAAGNNTWESYVAAGRLYTGSPSGTGSMGWTTTTVFAPNQAHPEWDGSMPHSGIMTICGGSNNHITVTDSTAGISIWNAGRDKYGTGQEIVTVPVIKGHVYSVSADHTAHGGSAIGSSIIFFFGD